MAFETGKPVALNLTIPQIMICISIMIFRYGGPMYDIYGYK